MCKRSLAPAKPAPPSLARRLCEGRRLRLSEFVPHVTPEEAAQDSTGCLEYVFPAAIAPSPVAFETSFSVGLHVVLVDGSLYRLEFQLEMAKRDASFADLRFRLEREFAADSSTASLLAFGSGLRTDTGYLWHWRRRPSTEPL